MNGTRFIDSVAIARKWDLRCAANISDYAIEKNDIQRVLMKFVFPVQFTVAIAGNLLTLAVLLSGASNRANRLLAFLAVCDCLLLLSMVIDSVITYETFYVVASVRLFYYEYRWFTAVLSNWFSAASVWFVLAISVERLLIIKFPFRSLNGNQNRQVIIIALIIMFVTFCTSQVNRFTNFCFAGTACNGTEIRGSCFQSVHDSDMNHISQTMRDIAPKWMLFNTFFVVLIPVAIVIAINISLLRIVKRSNKQELVRSASSCRPRRSDEQERSMTRAIVAIVTCFSITQGPSGLLYLVMYILDMLQLLTPETAKTLHLLLAVTNTLVLTGKMSNFLLFCMTSATFRTRLLNTTHMWCYKLGFTQRPVLNRKYVYASPTGTSTDKTRTSFSQHRPSFSKPRVSFTLLDVSETRPVHC